MSNHRDNPQVAEFHRTSVDCILIRIHKLGREMPDNANIRGGRPKKSIYKKGISARCRWWRRNRLIFIHRWKRNVRRFYALKSIIRHIAP